MSVSRGRREHAIRHIFSLRFLIADEGHRARQYPAMGSKQSHKAVIVLLFGGIILGAALAMLGACGIFTAPVSVPVAVASNKQMILRGTVVDDEGQPLDEVLVDVKREHTVWSSSGGTDDVPHNKTVAVSQNFSFDFLRSHRLQLQFHKRGYADREIEITMDDIRSNGFIWPPTQQARVVLRRPSAKKTELRYLRDTITYDQLPKERAIDLARASSAEMSTIDLGNPASIPAGTLYVEVETQPLQTHGPDNRVDPLDVGLPRRITLRISGPESGLLRFTPQLGCGPIEQMTEAPADGYQSGLTLDTPRLREMRKLAKGSDRNTRNNQNIGAWEFFWLRAQWEVRQSRAVLERRHVGFADETELRRLGAARRRPKSQGDSHQSAVNAGHVSRGARGRSLDLPIPILLDAPPPSGQYQCADHEQPRLTDSAIRRAGRECARPGDRCPAVGRVLGPARPACFRADRPPAWADGPGGVPAGFGQQS